jgi:Family of unknown function (DUF5677)
MDDFKRVTTIVGILAGVGFGAWLIRRIMMPELKPSGVGDGEMQKRFIEAHGPFIREFRNIEALKNRIIELIIERYNKTVEPGSEPLSHDTPEYGARLADMVLYSLLKAAFEDFGELLILAGNGLGFGATKILRSLYERAVMSAFIGNAPAEAVMFVEQDAIDLHKLRERLFSIAPQLKDDFTPEQIQALDDRYEHSKARAKAELCTKCGQPKSDDAWARVALDKRAEAVDKATGTDFVALYSFCYLVPTYHAHAKASGLQMRLEKTDTGWSDKNSSEREADGAVMRGHCLLLKMFKQQNAYFNLGLDGEVRARWDAFDAIWGVPDCQGKPENINVQPMS